MSVEGQPASLLLLGNLSMVVGSGDDRVILQVLCIRSGKHQFSVMARIIEKVVWIYLALEISLLSGGANESPEFVVNLCCWQYGSYFEGKQYGNKCYWYLIWVLVKITVTDKTPMKEATSYVEERVANFIQQSIWVLVNHLISLI